MDAREELKNALVIPEYKGFGEYGYTEEEAEGLLNAFAHQLAEKIRQDCERSCLHGDRCTCPHNADLIDPRVGPESSGEKSA